MQGSATTPGSRSLILETKDSPAKVHDFYKSKLAGMKQQLDLDQGDSKSIQFVDGKTAVMILASGSAGKTEITIAVSGS